MAAPIHTLNLVGLATVANATTTTATTTIALKTTEIGRPRPFFAGMKGAYRMSSATFAT